MTDYTNYSKEELLKLVQNKDKELKSKKYGLVWDSEREPEQVVLDCENNLPVLKRLKSKEIKTDVSKDNILIEGDNYHALSVLNYTHKEKIDVIYIDPPYNTGNKDFIYNDRYVDKEDGYRHSKWLNFMEKRLKLAHNLLKKAGVIFISIDDNEMAQLKLLCDRVFGEDNFVGQFIWQKQGNDNKSIFSGVKTFRNDHELIMTYSKNKSLLEFKRPEEKAEFKNDYGNADNDPRGNWMSAELGKSEARSIPHGKNYYTLTTPNGTKWTRQWHHDKDKMNDLINKNRVYFGKEGVSVPRFKKFLNETTKKIPSSILVKQGSTKIGQSEVDSIFNGQKIFSYPKPSILIKYLVNLSKNKNSTILDFMAGSGTTGHAVLDLNKEDGGNRKFILCTNNENNICSDVTYPRIDKVINGYKKNGDGEKVDGLGGNLQYLRTSFVKNSKNKEQLKINLTKECTEMLCLKEGIFNEKKITEDYKIFESNDKKSFLCIYYNFIDKSFEEFLKEIKKLNGKKKIYIFSLDGKVNRNDFKEINDFKIEPIPQKILEIYRQLVKQNISANKDLIFLEFGKAQKLIFDENEKEDSAKRLRIVLEKVLKKIAQNNSINIFGEKVEKRVSQINEELKESSIISHVEWEENKTYFTIGNNAAHGDYDEYDLEQVKNFYKHIQNLINKFEL